MPQKVNVRVGKIVSVSLRILFVETDKELGIVFKRSYRDSRVQEEKLCAAGHGLASRPSVPYVRKPRLDRACRLSVTGSIQSTMSELLDLNFAGTRRCTTKHAIFVGDAEQ